MKEEVSNVELEDFSSSLTKSLGMQTGDQSQGKGVIEKDYSLIEDVEVSLSAYIGDAQVPVGELFSMTKGSVVSLNTKLNEPVVLYIKDKAVAKGNIVAVDDSFGVEISEII